MADYSAFFSIEVDHSACIVLVRISGFWDDAVMAAFEAAMAQSIVPLEKRGRLWSNIGDTRESPPQSAEIVAKHAAVFNRYSDVFGGRVALVTDGALARRQAGRVIGNDQPQIFHDVESARAWLSNRGQIA